MEDTDEEPTVVSVCPSCLERRRVLALPAMKGATVTSICVGGEPATPWTVMVRRGHNVVATGRGPTQEDALFEALTALGVMA